MVDPDVLLSATQTAKTAANHALSLYVDAASMLGDDHPIVSTATGTLDNISGMILAELDQE